MKSMKYFYKMWKGINELSESLLLGILFFILLNLTLQNYEVVGDSMVPNYNQGDRLLLLKFSYLKNPNSDEYIKPFNPKRGDVVVFNYPNNPERKFIKRVIGISGDTIEISNSGKIRSKLNKTFPILEASKITCVTLLVAKICKVLCKDNGSIDVKFVTVTPLEDIA